MTVKINNKGLEIIKSFEGCVLHTYNDGVGVATIGYGHTGKVNNKTLSLNKPICITKIQAENLLKADLKSFEKAVINFDKKHSYNLNENEFSALVSFAFNLGIGSLEQVSTKGKRTKQEIANSMLLYNKAGGRVLQGLIKRRQAEVNLFNTPVNKKLSISQIAKEVIDGKWGNGEQRKLLLTQAGYDYKKIQKKVNDILKKR